MFRRYPAVLRNASRPAITRLRSIAPRSIRLQNTAHEEITVIKRQMPKKGSKGFTLFELMVTLAVAGVILSFGIPGFMSFIQNNRATTHTNDLIMALNLGRSEATRRAAGVTVCSSANGSTCSGSNDWSSGWVVRSDGGTVIRTWPARSGGSNVITGNVSQVRFLARGSLPGGVVPHIEVRLPDCTGELGRDVEVNAAGRISVDRVTC